MSTYLAKLFYLKPEFLTKKFFSQQPRRHSGQGVKKQRKRTIGTLSKHFYLQRS